MNSRGTGVIASLFSNFHGNFSANDENVTNL